MHLNKTKFERNLSLGFDVCNIKKAGGATCTLQGLTLRARVLIVYVGKQMEHNLFQVVPLENSRSNGMFALSLYCLLGQDVANGYSFSSCQTSSLKLVKGPIS